MSSDHNDPRAVDETLFGKVERVDVMAAPPLGRPAVVLTVHKPPDVDDPHVYVELDDRTLDALEEGRRARDELIGRAVH